ncbi:MAG TPA: cytochrome c3 family protein [Myxococcales bacterium]|nr:cytochrome c3 family protein [Myxococcales bacterium]
MRALLLLSAVAVASAAPAGGGEPPVSADGVFTAFNHRVHVTDNLIGCGTCHPYARHSAVAGVASLSRCMGCHKFAGKDKPAIQAIAAAARAKQPLQFWRVFREPDHVYFSHERHLARGVACAECHGDVAHMTQDVRVKDMHMGFCVECHRLRQANIDCITCHK